MHLYLVLWIWQEMELHIFLCTIEKSYLVSAKKLKEAEFDTSETIKH